MFDRVKAYTDIDPDIFTPQDITAYPGWLITRGIDGNTGEVRWGTISHSAPRATRHEPHPLRVELDLKRNRLGVEATLPRLLCGNNWQTMAESDVPRACALVDTYLARCLGTLAEHLPPFVNWSIRKAEYPHDVRLGSRSAVEQVLRSLNGRPMQKTGVVPRPYSNGGRGKLSGLTWGTRATRRKTTIYDKSSQCGHEGCPTDLLRIETCIQESAAWEGYRTPEIRREGRALTVAEAGTVRVATLVLGETYDALRLERVAPIDTGDPFPILVEKYGESQARTLAGFHDYTTMRGEQASRVAFGRAFTKHRKRLVEAGVSVAWGADALSTDKAALTLAEPTIPRPTSAYLAAREPIDTDLRRLTVFCHHRSALTDAPKLFPLAKRLAG